MRVDGDAFKKARTKQLLSSFGLAKQAGVSPNIVRNIEMGKTPRADTVRKVISALGLTVEEALDRRMIMQ
ncbi:MAG: helix-turn-helix domain-containing protein [Deltaproteobacteria bacterium]|jgi:predicted transcriptional regulator|nr:helix-turn-helix domain-containing protein [Deltaproteobacteria bacterium]